MRILFNRSFLRALSTFESEDKKAIKQVLDRFLDQSQPGGDLPAGLGMKRLRARIFEIRAGLGTRMVFARTGDILEWLFVGSHDEVRRFLRHF